MIRVETSRAFAPEKLWVIGVIFRDLLEVEYAVEWVGNDSAGDAAAYLIVLPNGSTVSVEDHFFARQPTENYLTPEALPSNPSDISHPFVPEERLALLYGRDFFVLEEKSALCGLDLFAAAFFMLSRWEEYVKKDRDTHGRFPASASTAFQTGFLGRPVVQEYAALLRFLFAKLGVVLPPFSRKPTVVPSHDIDHPRLWPTLPARLRTLAGSLLARHSRSEAMWWANGPIWRAQDPFDTFDYLMGQSESNGWTSHFYAMGERKPSSDCYYPLSMLNGLLGRIAERGHIVGYHPSYECFDNPTLFGPERRSIQNLLANADAAAVNTGRHHYLRFAVPHTWQLWENQGMKMDSTLGYSDCEGFRCGICVPYPVFNILTRQPLGLLERPLVAMDVTLAAYRRYTPAESFDVLCALKRQVWKHQGEFTLLWHNSSFNTPDWEGWEAVYEAVLG